MIQLNQVNYSINSDSKKEALFKFLQQDE
jgi:hypothetical protein